MRTRLTEIISTIDQYNGFGEYSEEYKGGEKVDICSEMPDMPDKATISEGTEKIVRDMLLNEHYENNILSFEQLKPNILSFEDYINENYQIKPPRLSDADYDDRPKGWRDEFEEDEEE